MSSDATKILEKGPEYLRKQMELEGETKGQMSAVERLAASKPKYVKSQLVISSAQEPVISGSALSGCSSNHGGKLVPERKPSEQQGVAQLTSPGQVHRSSSKKRPDSLLLYRQKCDLRRGSGIERKPHVARRLNPITKNVPVPESLKKQCETDGRPEGKAKECAFSIVVSESEKSSCGVEEENSLLRKSAAGGLLQIPEDERKSGKGVNRSHSDISSRYSKNFANFDAFFKYCGLDGEVIKSLGEENFSVYSDEIEINIRSVSVSTSDDGFSKDSDDMDGLQEDELHKKIRQVTSVIERNARVIKWLYSCKNATETGKKLRDLD